MCAARLRKSLAVGRYAKSRPKRTHNLAFEMKEGMDFIGLEDFMEPMQEHNRWLHLAATKPVHSNVRVIEYICAARAVADQTLASLDPENKKPSESTIMNAARGVAETLEAVWFHGVDDSEEVDNRMRYSAWTALQTVCAVRDFRTQLNLPSAPKVLIERGVAVHKDPIASYTLRTLVSAMERLVRLWPHVVMDKALKLYVEHLRMRYFSLVCDCYERRTGILDYEAYVDCGTMDMVYEDEDGNEVTKVVEVLSINLEFDRYMYATFCGMMLDMEKHIAFRKQMRSINEGKKIKTEAMAPICSWMALRAEDAGNASHIVLGRFRTSFFYYYERPGNADQYQYKCVEKLGQEQLKIQQQDYEALKKQAETEFSFLYPEEFKSFSTNYFDCDPEYIVSCQNFGTFGKDAFSLFMFLGFAHVFDVQMDEHWLGKYFMMMPSDKPFFECKDINKNLFVRFRGDFYIVDTQNMIATHHTEVWDAIRSWLRVYMEIAPTQHQRDYAGDLHEAIFKKGKFNLRPFERKVDAYSSNPLIDTKAIRNIYYK